jgi:hypothetical protein
MSESRKLPPSDRDFEIYESVHIQNRTWPTATHISQTRVRQIVRRVVEWLAEVLPPQAQVAKEQELYLARQIAADRFQHQLEEVAYLWEETRESKYAGIRIRLTTAQARLGVVGGVAAGLAADAIEGIEVPAYVPPRESREGEAPAEPEVGRGSPDPAHSSTAGLPDASETDSEPLVIYADPICWNELTPEIIAAREAAGMPIPQSLIQYAIDHGALPRSDAQAAAEPSSEPTTLPIPQSDNPHSNPPPGDFSAVGCMERVPADETHHAPAETHAATLTCDDSATHAITAEQPSPSTAQPLLTIRDALPITQVELTPQRSGAAMVPITPHDGPREKLIPLPAARQQA